MIWNSTTLQEYQESLADHLLAEISRVCGPAAPPLEQAEELARGVAAYCAIQGPDRTLPASYISMLLARALRGIGAEAAAACFAVADANRDGAARAGAAGIWTGEITPDWWNVFASGLVRPARWLSADGEAMWVLDFARLAKDGNDSLELALCRGVRIILEQLAEAWDETGGDGVLGLTGLRPVADASDAVRRAARRRARELSLYCDSVLEHMAPARAWKDRPRVLVLDLAINR